MSESLDECSICCEPKEQITFHCNHKFCYDCYKNITGVKKCPFCRRELVDLNLVGRTEQFNHNCAGPCRCIDRVIFDTFRRELFRLNPRANFIYEVIINDIIPAQFNALHSEDDWDSDYDSDFDSE
jgi:hypothetical protein